MTNQLEQKKQLADHIVSQIQNGETIVFGSGSTVNQVIEKVADHNISVKAVAASYSTSFMLQKCGVSEISLGTAILSGISYCIDGVDEVYPIGEMTSNQLHPVAIKGHGGAFVKEKITWSASPKILVLGDSTKVSLGISKSIPIEVIPFAYPDLIQKLVSIPNIDSVVLKETNSLPYLTDNGNIVLHLTLKSTITPEKLEDLHHQLKNMVGIVETGIFTKSLLQKAEVLTVRDMKIQTLKVA